MNHLLIQQFAAVKECKPPGFFSLPTWDKYLGVKYEKITDRCEVQFSLLTGSGNNKVFNGSDVLLVGLGVIDILIRVAALVAVGFVIYGGIRYITSQGSPDATKGAQNTILTALIGLAITIVAAAVVAFLGRAIT